jgi:hypothetical protein
MDERLERVQYNLRTFAVPRLREPLPLRDDRLIVCGYGPSLHRTWQIIKDAKDKPSIMTTSGSHDFLIDRGILPHFHVEIDPREHKTHFIRNSHPDVHYLISSSCHPRMFEMLKDRKVTMWHGFTDEDKARQVAVVESMEPGSVHLSGGTNVGMRSIPVGRHLGWWRFSLHGIDCCYEGELQWAGEHSGERHATVRIRTANGRDFETSDLMMTSVDDFFNQLNGLGRVAISVEGNGLLADVVEIYRRDPCLARSPSWWKPLNFNRNFYFNFTPKAA